MFGRKGVVQDAIVAHHMRGFFKNLARQDRDDPEKGAVAYGPPGFQGGPAVRRVFRARRYADAGSFVV